MKKYLIAFFAAFSVAQAGGGEGPADFILEHVKDSYDWHIVDIPWGKNPDGTTHYIPISIPLPRIIYHPTRGLSVFFVHGHTREEIQKSLEERGFTLTHQGKIAAIDCQPIWDFSLTKTAFQFLLVGLLLLGIGRAAAKAYAQAGVAPPRGIARWLEPAILFIRDEVARPSLHHHAERFLPYLLSVFFFIWLSNLFGLTPFNSNIMGNITLTFLLALLTFILVQVNGTKSYWEHIFWYPGVPVWLKVFMMPIEVIGMFSKPFALMMRLFANILAGHLMTLSVIGLIFILSALLKSIGVGYGVAIFSVLLGLFVIALETLVAALQAYIFTMLTAVFLGMALEESH
ncbi:MAG: F0F1 ATP synthase subunit A [Bacteroidia bacterium]|jgi:F-type H+-transporting ATPase subunit a|nr:F0F1 ATP synthase subunit A [Bacteroidia bacterium]GIV23903.1 MAG: ATP synthase subunit a [Bacteroidia bacterium]